MFLFGFLTVLLFINDESNQSDEDETKNKHCSDDDDGHVSGLLC